MLALVSCGVQAKTKKSDPGPHPLKVIKFVINNNMRDMGSASGSFEVWLQNTSEYIVDKVHMDIEIYNRDGRYLDKVTKDIGKLNPGQKKIFELRYNIMGSNDTLLAPHLWLYYNAGKERLTQFEVNVSSGN